MKTRAIIQARMLSQRLRGKSLMSVAGIPLLYRVVNNIKQISFIDEIMIATTRAEADDPIAAAANNLGVNIYRGDSQNVLKRYKDASADMDYDRVWSALRAAQLTEYVHGLSEGIHTIVGERGVRMSGGQRQRVGIARALYHNPDVIIMDEATSALDNQTESLVMEALDNLKAGRTFIMIAHRLSTVQQCDQLYFLEQGEVMASGTYEELTKQNEAFRLLATLPS